MKRFSICILAAVLALATSAGASARGFRSGGVGTGINFGYLNSAYRTVDWATDELTDKSGMNGLYVGMNHDATLIHDALYLETGLYYTFLNEARRETLTFLSNKLIGDRTEHYLNLPVRVKYSFPVSHWLKVFAYGGPTMSVGLSSKLNYRTRLTDDQAARISYNYYNGDIQSRNMPEGALAWFNDQLPPSQYRRFDVLLGGAFGAEFFDMLEVHIGYDWGLINRNKGDYAEDFKTRRNQFYFSVGLRF